MRGTITLENQQEHSWISIVLRKGRERVLIATDSDGSYRLPTLGDGVWALTIAFPYYLAYTDTLQVTNGLVTPGIGDLTLTQALEFRTTTARAFYAMGDSVYITSIVHNLTPDSVTVVTGQPGLPYVIRQGTHTITQLRFLYSTIVSTTYPSGEMITRLLQTRPKSIPQIWVEQ